MTSDLLYLTSGVFEFYGQMVFPNNFGFGLANNYFFFHFCTRCIRDLNTMLKKWWYLTDDVFDNFVIGDDQEKMIFNKFEFCSRNFFPNIRKYLTVF